MGPTEFLGWSWANTSILTAHGTHEVTGGRILVWAPDGKQVFPTDFGADGKLFTADDPLGPLAAGWTAIDLGEHPFVQERSAVAKVDIQPDELAPDDLSQLTPTQSFDRLVEILRARYPFADAIPLDWGALHAKFRPEFEAAERSGEKADYWLALNHFLIALHNWSYFAVFPYVDVFAPLVLGATGLHAELSDDGKVIVAKVDPGQPAARAGISAGAEIVAWDGKPATQALDQTLQFFTESSPQNILLQKEQNFGRVPVGTTVHVEYRNPGADTTAATDLTAVEIPNEDVGKSTHCYHAADICAPLKPPVWVERLPSNIAVLHVGYFATDVQGHRSIVDSWEQALRNLGNSDVKGLIIDLRNAGWLDSGTMPVYMAGSFFKKSFPLADITSVDANGHNLTVGTIAVNPAPVQWDRPVALLVDGWCKGTCELFVQALKHRPDVTIVGRTPTGGSLANTMESVLLPTGNFVLVVDQAYHDPVTHEIIAEGKGFEPTLRVPKTAETIVENVATDLVRNAAEQALLAQIAGSEKGVATPQA